MLLSVDYIGEGDYYQGEYYFLLLTSVLGMIVMASARDLITIFVALETLSIPTYMLAGVAQARPEVATRPAIKYYLIGVFSSAVMLYGMSLIFGVTGTTLLVRDLGRTSAQHGTDAARSTVAIFLVARRLRVQGRARCRSTSGRPTPTRARPRRSPRSCRSRRRPAGFVALLSIIFFGFFGHAATSWEPVLWVLAARVDDRRQPHRAAPDQHRAHARVLVDRAGRLHPRAVRGRRRQRRGRARRRSTAVVIYLLIYGAMNLGAFAVVIAVARTTRSAEISSYGGLFAVRARARGR